MSELGPRAKELIAAGKEAHDPSPSDEARVLESLRTRLASGERLEPGDGTSLPPPARPLWPLISVGVVGAGLVLGGIAWSLSSAPSPARRAPSFAPREPAAAVLPPEPQGDAADAAAPAAPEVLVTNPEAKPEMPRTEPSPNRPRSRLAEEVAILARATSALHAGRPGDALRAAAEHQEKFPGGVLTEERVAVRAQALCQLGKKKDAERELDRLSPSSPQLARARQHCGLD